MKVLEFPLRKHFWHDYSKLVIFSIWYLNIRRRCAVVKTDPIK